jgi:hypothetical protein
VVTVVSQRYESTFLERRLNHLALFHPSRARVFCSRRLPNSVKQPCYGEVCSGSRSFLDVVVGLGYRDRYSGVRRYVVLGTQD